MSSECANSTSNTPQQQDFGAELEYYDRIEAKRIPPHEKDVKEKLGSKHSGSTS